MTGEPLAVFGSRWSARSARTSRWRAPQLRVRPGGTIVRRRCDRPRSVGGRRRRSEICENRAPLESIPGPFWRPAFAKKQTAIVDPPPSPPPSPARGRGSNARPLSRVRERVGVRVVACPPKVLFLMSTDELRVGPWAQEVIPSGAGFSRVAADGLLPPTLLGRTPARADPNCSPAAGVATLARSTRVRFNKARHANHRRPSSAEDSQPRQ